jgi:hypothetical protein
MKTSRSNSDGYVPDVGDIFVSTCSGGIAMAVVKLTIHDAGSGTCSLTGKESDGLTVTFEDGTVRESHLSWKAFRQLLGMKTTQGTKPEPKLAANGPVPLATPVK